MPDGKRKRISPTFGRRLRELRVAAGLTQKELGERAGGLMHSAIARLEAGMREAGWQTVLKLANALNVPTDAFRDKNEE